MVGIGWREVVVGPFGKRRCSDTYKGRVASVTLVPGVPVNEVVRRHDLQPNHLSARLRQGKRPA